MSTLPGLHGLSLRALVTRTYHEFSEDDALSYASALAFHLMLALFPFLLFLFALASYLPIDSLLQRLLEWSRTVLPTQAFQPVAEAIRNFGTRRMGVLSFGMLAALWAGSGGVRSAMTALNAAYDLEDDRPRLRRYALSVGFTLAIGALLLLGMALMLLGPQVVQWAADQVGLGNEFMAIWRWARYPVALLLLMLGASLAYTILPNGVRFQLITPGAIVAILLWVLGALGFRLYVGNFGRFHLLYGSVGAVLVLLLFLWISSIAVLLGGEINGVIAAHRHGYEGNTAPAPRRLERET